MNIDKKKNGISRSEFLKSSGIMLGGFALRPNSAVFSDLISFDKLLINGISGFHIVAIRINNPHNPNPAENPDIIKVAYQSFSTEISNWKVRYIKVHAESLLHMPSWHINAGQPAVIYSDEILVK